MLDSPFGYGSTVVWVRCCPLVAVGSLFKATSNPQVVIDSSRLGCTKDGPCCSVQLGFNNIRGMSANNPSHWRICSVCLYVSTCCCLSLVIDLSVSKKSSAGIGGIRFLSVPWQVPFRLQGRWWVCSTSSSPLVSVCSGLFPCIQQGGAPTRLSGGASRVPVLGLPETGRVFLWLSPKGRHQSVSWENTWYVCTLQPVSDTLLLCVCCCLLSRG